MRSQRIGRGFESHHLHHLLTSVEFKGCGCAARIGFRQACRVMETAKKPIRSFHDLEVYQNTYQAMLMVFKHILPTLPKEEEFDLKNQLRRSTKAIPRLIAEGHSKRHQRKGFQKYLDDAMAESNETIVSLSQARDIYPDSIPIEICNELIDTYDKASRQLYNLSVAWTNFNERKNTRNPISKDETSSSTG